MLLDWVEELKVRFVSGERNLFAAWECQRFVSIL